MATKQSAAGRTADRPAAADGSSRKILRALLAFSVDRPRHSAESLSDQIGVPLSSTYRYIAILREAELIDEDGRGTFVLAPRVIGLAQAARASTDLPSIARPFMKRASQQSGETIILLRRSGDRAVCIERTESSMQIRLSYEVGTSLALHRGAGPKLLLAHLPENERNTILDEAILRDPSFAPNRPALLRELATIREQGWSESRAEITQHVYAISVPVHGPSGVIAVLTFLTPAFRTPKACEIRLRAILQQTADDIRKAYAAASF